MNLKEVIHFRAATLYDKETGWIAHITLQGTLSNRRGSRYNVQAYFKGVPLSRCMKGLLGRAI